MKKRFVLFICALLAMALLTACASSVPDTTDAAGTTAGTTAPVTDASTTAAEVETTAATEPPASERTTAPAQNLAALWEDRLASLQAQADAIEYYLEHEAVTQSDMNEKAQELYVLWDTALNELWADLEDALPEDDFDALLDEQLTWIDDKEAAVKAAGADVEGGSMYPMVTNSEAAAITQQRVYELYELLK